MHAALRGEVVRRRGRVGRRCDQDAVFEECDAAAAIQARSANTDVRPKAEAFFFLDIDAWHHAQDAHDVALNKGCQLFLIDKVGRARDVGDVTCPADDGDIIERGLSVLRCVLGRRVVVLGLGRCRRHDEHDGAE